MVIGLFEDDFLKNIELSPFLLNVYGCFVMHHMNAWCPKRPEEDSGSAGA